MKELSTEQKAKAYEQAIKRAKAMIPVAANQEEIYNSVITIFPELEESEDERIKKELLGNLRELSKMYDTLQTEKEYSKVQSWIAWLEKQGASVPDWMPKFLDELRSKKNYFNWDEHKDIEGGILAIIKWMNPNYFNGKDGKQIPANKVEPKFKVGDLIKLSKEPKYPAREIISIKNDGYYFDSAVYLPFKRQDDWELVEQKPDEWEPQTGDTFRKKGTTSPTYHLCNKREDGITFGFVENREVGIAGGEITIFALKNNYELVERPKSIEDVVEEELNRALQTKVEQNPWSEEDESNINDIRSLIYENCDAETASRLIEWLMSLKPQPKQEWSEEDEKIMNTTLCIISDFRNVYKDSKEAQKDADKIEDWLKSFRLKNTWKPSGTVIDSLSIIIKHPDRMTDYNKKNLIELLEQLKKLREE